MRRSACSPWIPVLTLTLALAVLGVAIGQRTVDAQPETVPALDPPARGSMGITTGPDVTVLAIAGIRNWGASGSLRGYSIGTDSCNIGSEPVNWCDDGGCVPPLTIAQHPVIAQNLYRLRDGRFEQIGMSWLKHGFVSTNSFDSECRGNDGAGNPTACTNPPLGGHQLGVGCTDFYGSILNGGQPLGARSEVNATTGVFPFPEVLTGTGGAAGQRIQVAESELTGAGDRFWVEAQYVADNDALFGNGLNNASYLEVSVDTGDFDISAAGPTVREVAAIHAWQAVDPLVEIVHADVDGPKGTNGPIVERFHAARRVTDLGGGQWHYEIAVHNLNSDRSARSLTVAFPGATGISNVGFHDVDHHSGEPFDTADWAPAVDGGAGTVSWSTDAFAKNANANALRWGTMFSFRFDADRGPDGAVFTLGLFKPGSPSSVPLPFAGSPDELIFTDGFESGDTSAWSSTQP